jgi:hypothetical protein
VRSTLTLAMSVLLGCATFVLSKLDVTAAVIDALVLVITAAYVSGDHAASGSETCSAAHWPLK